MLENWKATNNQSTQSDDLFSTFSLSKNVHTTIQCRSYESIYYSWRFCSYLRRYLRGETTKAETLKVNTKMCYFIDKSRYISQLYLDLVSWLRGSPGETRAKHCKRKSPQELKETHGESRNRMAFIPCHLHEPLLSFLASPPDVSLLRALDEQVVKRFPIKRPSCAGSTSPGNVTQNIVWKRRSSRR